MQRKYRITKEKYFPQYFIAQYRFPFIPIWFSIKTNKLPHLGLYHWHRSQADAHETCIEHSKGRRWKKNEPVSTFRLDVI